jgi:putative two-component system response regulator
MLPILKDRQAVTLIDRDRSTLPRFQEVLRSFGLGLQHVSSAEEGLDLLRRRPTPIVVADLHLPLGPEANGLGGLTFARHLKQTRPESSLMLLAENDDLGLVGDCLRAGADRLLLKPVRPPQLRRALAKALKQQFAPRHGPGWPTPPEFNLQEQLRELRSKLSEALNSLLLTLELRDPTTRGHARRVRRYARILAADLGISEAGRKEIGLAAKMHDIGKVGIAEAILRKPGNLTPEEAQQVQSHTIIGENLLRTMVDHPRVLAAVRHHHERMDGRGYPDQLAGNLIPFEARLISVVDCFDALTSMRPYRLQPFATSEALEILHRQADGHLDPLLVRSFSQLLSRRPQIVHEVRSLR